MSSAVPGGTPRSELARSAARALEDHVLKRGWGEQFCRASIGATREEMGDPSEDYTPENTPSESDPQMNWQAYHYGCAYRRQSSHPG